MAAIRPRSALAALTSAALGLPGLAAQAATPIVEPEANVQYGHYEESDNRMKVDVDHADFIAPVGDRMEFTFSIDRDTYSGASPAYSIPATMANQIQYSQQGVKRSDVVSAASGGVTAAGLTVLGGLNTFKGFIDARAAAEAQYRANNPEPSSSSQQPGISAPVTLNFQGMQYGAYFGKSNDTPAADGACVGTANAGCYYESGMAAGTISVPAPQDANAHIHRGGTSDDRNLLYHEDSGGIYIRAINNAAFSLNSLSFISPVPAGTANPNTPPNVWEILGFSTAINPKLSSGNGTNNYPSEVAYQQVSNGYNGTLTLNQSFQNINAFWIHYKGYPSVPQDGVNFKLAIDNVNLAGVNTNTGKTPEQLAWEKEFDKQVTIAQYSALLNAAVPAKTQTVQRMQTQPLETRTMPVFGMKYYFDNALLALSGGYSDEPDYRSNFGSANYSHELNDKHTTLSAGYSLTSNAIYRNGDAHAGHHATDPSHNPTDYAPLGAGSTFQGFTLGITQVLGKNTLLQATGTYTNQGGYLANPYKTVYVRGEITPDEYYYLFNATSPGQVNWKSVTNLEVVGSELFRETRPNLRNQGSISVGVNQHVPDLQGTLNADYRFFSDDWGINSHTFELRWFQPISHGIMISPNIRYYSQSHAYFYAPYFLEPRADGYYSSDYRLSAYGALSGGITISKKFAKGITLQAGFEYYTHAGSLKLGGGGEDAFADFNYYVAHAGLNFSLSSPPPSAGEHSHHAHHGAPPPAGVMFGHMLDKADDIMVGYRYMYSNQSGDMWNGPDSVTDQVLLASRGCGRVGCAAKPANMTMNMHMFDFMYAPTDWLNLMVMPQVVDMSMDRVLLPGASTEDHIGKHTSSGMGDTILMALTKVYEDHTHHVHSGLGLSAPTGDANATMDGQHTDASVLQDYGMQRGSGTWDFKPSVTYTGHSDKLSWGAQLSGVVRLEGRNTSGYALGNLFQSTAWGSYSLLDWLSASVRGVYTLQGAIHGDYNSTAETSSPSDYSRNYGGSFWDVGFGLNLSAPDSGFAGHNLSLEYLQPLADNFNGYQLERKGSLSAAWTYMF